MNQNIEKLAAKRQAEQQLQAEQSKIDQKQQRLDTLNWVHEQQHDYEQQQELTKQQEQLKRQKVTLTHNLTTQTQDSKKLDGQQKDLTANAKKMTGIQSEIAVLTEQRPLYEQVRQFNVQLDQETSEYTVATAALSKAQTDTVTQQDRLKQLNAQIDHQSELLKTSAQLTALQADQTAQEKRVSDLFDQQSQLAEKKKLVADAQSAVTAISQKVKTASADYENLRNQWLAGQIAVLASQLKPGTPCPVCGSVAHPAPHAVTETKLVDNETIKAAEQALQQLKDQQTKALADLSNQQQVLEKQTQVVKQQAQALRTQLKVQASVTVTDMLSQVTEQEAQTEQQLGAVKQQLLQIDQAIAERQTKTAEIERQQQTIQTLKQRVQSAKLTQQTTQTKLDAAQKQLPAQFADLTALDDYLTQQRQRVADYQQQVQTNHQALQQCKEQIATTQANLHTTESTLQVTEQRLTKLTGTLEQAVKVHLGADQMTQFIGLMGQLDEISALKQTLQDFQQAMTAAKADVAAYEQLVGDKQTVDLTVIQQQLNETKTQLKTAQKLADDRQQQVTVNGDILAQLKTTTHQVAAQLDELNELQLLVETVAGGGDNKLGLERYVLRAQLAEILVIANQHLKQLSSGRYSMQLHLEAGAYQKNTGLEIDVYDDNVGQVRSVHTLSGGESFIAALSLALALGESIQNESGGISIDALFIDEGFGSLDQESLSTAMKALENVESSNRMIGIISHVTLLQETIPYQIQVQPVGQGKSVAKIVLP